MKGDPIAMLRELLGNVSMDGRVVAIDIGTSVDGWPAYRVYFDPPLERGEPWRSIDHDNRADADECARIMSIGDLPIMDRTGGRTLRV